MVEEEKRGKEEQKSERAQARKRKQATSAKKAKRSAVPWDVPEVVCPVCLIPENSDSD